MTMLDRMRRHRGWLKWSLALVVLAFIVFYIPDFMGQTGTTRLAASPTEVARRDRRTALKAADFQQRYVSQIQAYRTQFGGSTSSQLLRQLGVDHQVLSQMIDEEVALAEAGRNGIRVSDDELAEQIFAILGSRRTAASSGRPGTSSCCAPRTRR